MSSPHEIFREYVQLERQRTGIGVTPLEYQRWLDLGRKLNQGVSAGTPASGAERRETVRVPSRLRVSFKDRNRFRQALMKNLSREGIFINTPFGPDVGTRLELRLGIDSTGEEHLIPVEVVSNNIGPDYSTASIGMGVRILDVSDDLRKVIDDLYESTGLRA